MRTQTKTKLFNAMTNKRTLSFFHFEPLPHKVVNTRVSFSEFNKVNDIDNKEFILKIDISK